MRTQGAAVSARSSRAISARRQHPVGFAAAATIRDGIVFSRQFAAPIAAARERYLRIQWLAVLSHPSSMAARIGLRLTVRVIINNITISACQPQSQRHNRARLLGHVHRRTENNHDLTSSLGGPSLQSASQTVRVGERSPQSRAEPKNSCMFNPAPLGLRAAPRPAWAVDAHTSGAASRYASAASAASETLKSW